MRRSLNTVLFVSKLTLSAIYHPPVRNLTKFCTDSNFSAKSLTLIGKMDLNDDLMCGQNGDVLEDTFGDEIDNLQPFPDGEFTIKSKKFNNFVLDLSQDVDGGIIHSYEYNSGDTQTWLLNYDADKEGYKIKNKKNTNLLLSWNSNVSKENFLRGYTKSDSRNHYWRIEQTEDGYFVFRNLDNLHMLITVQDMFSSLGGKQVIVDTENSSDKENNQKWMVNPVYFETVPNGNYNIFNSDLLDVVVGFSNPEDQQVHAQNYSVNENQEWQFSYNTDKEAYKIKSALNLDLLLTGDCNAATKEIALKAYKDTDNENQYWRIERTADGSYRLRNLDNLNLTLILNATLSDNLVGELKLKDQKDLSDDANIHSNWTIKSVSYQSIPDGDYNVFNSNLPNIVIDYSNQEDSLVHGQGYEANDNQTWSFVYNKDRKAYKIKNINSGRLLCWDSNVTSNEMFLRAYSESSCKNQYWRIENINNGSYRLRNVENTEKLITVIDKDNAYGGKQLTVSDSIGLSNTWILQKIGKPPIPNGKFKIAIKSNFKKVINSNQESKLFIIDNLNLVTSEWKIHYNTTKRAYTIYSVKHENLGWVFNNGLVILDNIGGPDAGNLRNYWMIEYRIQAGGYLIRSLCDPSQAISYTENNVIVADKATYSVNQLFNFIRN